MIEVMALPNWTDGNNYQSALARALRPEGFQTVYPTGYRRLFPLSRAPFAGTALLHLHWPEAYFHRGAAWDGLRQFRFPLDLALATRTRPLIYTAHNLLPHFSSWETITRRNYRRLLARADGIIAHSTAAAKELARFCPAAAPAISVVPHGDPADGFPLLPDRATSRRALGIDAVEPVVLMFGRVEPYKGIPEIMARWSEIHPTARLWIAGSASDHGHAQELQALAASQPRVTLELQWMSDDELATRFAASDAVLFNYRRIFTSGAGCLARSLGKKIILPERLHTVDLMEPASTVFRFKSVDEDLNRVLAAALNAADDPAGAAAWRKATSWPQVARQTAEVYRRALNERAR